MSILISTVIAMGGALLFRLLIDRQGRTTPGVVSGVAEDPGTDGMAPALLRPRAGFRLWWRSGVLLSESGQVWFETRMLHRRLALDGFEVAASRKPTVAEAARWSPNDFHVVMFASGGREYECAVYAEQVSFVMSLFPTAA